MRGKVLFAVFSAAMVLVLCDRSQAADSRLLGIWSAETYVIDGKENPIEGIFIFTDRYFSANTFS